MFFNVFLERFFINEPERDDKRPGILILRHFLTGDVISHVPPHQLLPVGIEPRRFFEKLQGLLSVLAGLEFLAEIDERFRIARISAGSFLEVLDGINPLQDPEDLRMDAFRRRRIAGDPVDFPSFGIEEKEKGRTPDVELLDQGFP